MPFGKTMDGRVKPGHDGGTVAMLGFTKKGPQHREALDRVREWVRRRFDLGDEAAILVAEVACAVPGCPPLETVVAFWFNERRHHYKVFKPVRDVTEDDLPPRWFMGALVVADDFECGCC
jgi:nitrate reductase delta subunit